jgi:hypothetical protein
LKVLWVVVERVVARFEPLRTGTKVLCVLVERVVA